jgi:hypothetical protein
VVISAESKTMANSINVGGVTGSDEVWFNSGDKRYYLAASRDCGKPGGCPAPDGGAVLGVVDARTNLLIEKIPQSQNSHSVAADSARNLIFVPQVAPPGDSTPVGAGICGGVKGCVAVYVHHGRNHEGEGDQD